MSEEIVTIDEIGPRGDGVALRDSDKARIFVPRSAAGDKLRVRVSATKQGLLRGEILEIIQPADEGRQTAPCPYYERCGGCQLQHIDTAYYKGWKQNLVLDTLKRRGVEVQNIQPPVFLGAQTRRRAHFSCIIQNKNVKLGYNQQRSHNIIEIDECLVLTPHLNTLKEKALPFLPSLLRDSRRASIFIQEADGRVEMVITGQLKGKRGVNELEVMETSAAMAHELGLARLCWREKDRDKPQTLMELAPFEKRFGKINVALPPAAFMQPSEAGEAALVNAVMTHMPSKGRFADLFAGSGCFAGHMAERGAVDAFDYAGDAITRLKKHAGGSGISAASRNLFERPLTAKELSAYDAVVFDPPRAGAKEQAEEMAQSKLPLIIGVSCNPRSLARDAEILAQGGYQLTDLQIIDQFIYSSHVEAVACFKK